MNKNEKIHEIELEILDMKVKMTETRGIYDLQVLDIGIKEREKELDRLKNGDDNA